MGYLVLAALKPEHKALERFWYDKLKKEGFIDIEDTTISNRPLLSWHSFKFCKTPKVKQEALSDYYYKASQLLNTYEFEKPIHRRIWELHCEGYSWRKIESIIQWEPGSLHHKKDIIGSIINRIAESIK